MTVPLSEHPRVAALLTGPLGWHTVEHLHEVGSTNDVALDRAREGVPYGHVVVADHQTAGRGRGGHRWDDAPDDEASLLVSAVLAPPPQHAQLVSLAGGLALADAIRRAGARPALKWPNDVLLDGRKCAGVLTERHRVGEREVMIVGLGLDVDWRGTDRDGEAANWTSVAESVAMAVDRGAVDRGALDRGDVLVDLLRALATWVRSVPTDPLRLLTTYRDGCVTIGRDVEVDLPDGTTIRGRAVDLDREGRLVVDRDGQQVAVNAGDVRHLPPAG
jgi:BirA family transcriptional regulator, biotin operon repressor / biotin---[acetyl-CoA-carboxylase] ligase